MRRRPSGWIGRVASLAALTGLLVGGAAGGALHEPLTGGDEGNPVEGLDWIVGGAFAGGLVGASVGGLAAARTVASARGRHAVRAVVGALALGTVAGLAMFPPTAPDWPLPVAAASLAGAGVGVLLAVAAGRRPVARNRRDGHG